MKANREDVVCTLLVARCLISYPEDWTQGANARNLYGQSVGPLNNSAVCWCAEGAVIAVIRGDIWGGCSEFFDETWRALTKVTGGAGLGPIAVNDRHGHAATLAMFDRAIEMADA